VPPLGLYVAFVGASLLLIAMPGPNAVLIVARTLSHGRRAGLATLAGTWSGAGIQLAIVVAGLTALAATLSDMMIWLRWAGAAYLILQGLRMLFEAAPDAKGELRPPPRDASLVLQGLVTGISNPKSLVFYGAFLPQFVAADRPAGPQLAILAATFLALALPGDSLWIVGANRLRRVSLVTRLAHRISGGLLIGAGAGLALVRRG
jgi:homoserine/homoserine lactone efflux protein